jgi:hypothetical protein
MLFNFGVLHDFFNYSAMSIQSSLHEIDLTNPPSSMQKNQALYTLKLDLENEIAQSGKSNIFAIAKVGLPNLILPSSLDIKLANYSSFTS